MCADHSNNPAVPKNLLNYTDSEMRMNNSYCKAYSGRMLRHNAVLKQARHTVAMIDVRSPIIELIFQEVHQKLHCGLGPQSYINGINLAGFCATGLRAYVQEKIDGCTSCTEAQMILKGVLDLMPNMKQFYGPDDFIANTIHQNPIKIVSLDEAGPFYLLNSQGEHDKTYILVCVELLTYKCQLIPLPRLGTLSFIRALEILQSLRGQMTTIILDDASFHNPLRQSDNADKDEFRKSALQGLLDNGHHSELHKSGIDIVITSLKRHKHVGRAEHIIKKIKFLLA